MQIDWDDLERALLAFDASGESQWLFDRTTGATVRRGPAVTGDDALRGPLDREPERFWSIEPIGTRERLQWMARFTAGLLDRAHRARLETALEGRGSSRRFRQVLAQLDGVGARWEQFHSRQVRQHARAWLVSHGLDPAE